MLSYIWLTKFKLKTNPMYTHIAVAILALLTLIELPYIVSPTFPLFFHTQLTADLQTTFFLINEVCIKLYLHALLIRYIMKAV